MNKIMRAISVAQFGGPDVLCLTESVPVPTVTENEVLVRVYSAGVNPVDTYIRSGTYARKPALPYIPGTDAAGIVEQVGANVMNFKVGQRVFCCANSGAYAEYCKSDVDHVFPLPDHISFAQGAAVYVSYFTAYRALFIKSNPIPSQTVLIHGASGAVGLATVQLAVAKGLNVIGTAGTAEGMEVVKLNGAQFVFNHREADYLDKIKTAAGPTGPNVIIEMLSNLNLANDLSIVAHGGTIAVVGCRGSCEINPRLCMQKECSIVGVMLAATTPSELKESGDAITAGLMNKTLDPVVDREYKLENAMEAHTDVINNVGAKGKLVLSV